MLTITIKLPDTIKQFVETQATSGGFANSSEYIEALLDQAYRRQVKEEIETKLLDALDSVERGEGGEMTEQDWKRLHSEYLQRHRQRKPR